MNLRELALGWGLSLVLHAAAALGGWILLNGAAAPDRAGAGATGTRLVRTGAFPSDAVGRTSAAAAPAIPETVAAGRYERPLDGVRPVFAVDTFGPKIDTRSGRVLRIDSEANLRLKPPRFTPYRPPHLTDPLPDATHDVLHRTRPVTYSRAELDREVARFQRELAEDLADCRLDMPLDRAILRARYLRLKKLLFAQGKAPDFSFDEMRDLFLAKLTRIHRSLKGVPAEAYFDTLLYEYRKNKIYEEKRGHSLFNAIFYDIYNCRTGTEELAIYFSLFHPELPLGINRGSIIKFDGSLIGHVDPAVRIDGRWTLFRTVSRSGQAVVPYAVGELFPVEKIVLDYLADFQAAGCRLDRPLARNGEEIDEAVDGGEENLHPLIVRHDDSRIVLLRETTPQPDTFAMVGREERLYHEMAGRYRGLEGVGGLLHSDRPYDDFLFHILAASPAERRDLVDLYLKNRVDARPAPAKRPLRIPDHLPGYKDLVRTLFSDEATDRMAILPGVEVSVQPYLAHRTYIQGINSALAELETPRSLPKKAALPETLGRFLFFFDGRGTTLIRPPAVDAQRLVVDLINDRYDLSAFFNDELSRRREGTSARRIAVLKAGLAGDDRAVRDALNRRIETLESVLAHRKTSLDGLGDRQANEVPGAVSYGETVRSGAAAGLSPGFVKDLVELMGEAGALSAFARYAASPAVNAGREAWLEMLGYMDRYLLMASNRERLVRIARERLDTGRSPAERAAAAQFLFARKRISAQTANAAYFDYIQRSTADVFAVASMLGAGLERNRARNHFRARIEGVDLSAVEAHQKLDRLARIAIILDDAAALTRIREKHVAYVLGYFREAENGSGGRDSRVGTAMNSLAYLARQGGGAQSGVFQQFTALGGRDPATLLLDDLMRRWMGKKAHGRAVAEALEHEQNLLSAELEDLAGIRGAVNALDDGSGLVAYEAKLARIRESAGRINFLAMLVHGDGRTETAYGHQRRLAEKLLAMDEFGAEFEKAHGAAMALERDRMLKHETIYRALELAGYYSKTLKKDGVFDLNRAPVVKPVGEMPAACGTTHRAVNSRIRPNTIAFTPADAYFTSLLDPDNGPDRVARAVGREQALLNVLAAVPVEPAAAQDMDETRRFFRDMARSGECDIRRAYVFEKLLRQSALPETLPRWILDLALDSHQRESAFMAKIVRAGGVNAVVEDYRRLPRWAFEERWGRYPFSIRNLYGTLLRVKTGHLTVDGRGAFVPAGEHGG